MERLAPIWAAVRMQVPKYFFAFYKDRHFAVINDSESVFTFMSAEGGFYMAVRSKCIPAPVENPTYYHIVEDGALQIVSCIKADKDPKEEHFVKTLIPILFQGRS